MIDIRPSTLAWGVLGAGVAAYDVACPPGETMSEAVDRALERPVGKCLALGGIALVATHLANLLPERYDPIHYALAWRDKMGQIVDEAMDVFGDADGSC